MYQIKIKKITKFKTLLMSLGVINHIKCFVLLLLHFLVSNLKNNYAEVRLWNYQTERFARTGLQFCGLMMGDHSKCGINTMFNTGTVIGVSANIFGSGFPRNFIPSFSWGGASGFSEYKTNKVFEVAEVVMQRRNIDFDTKEKTILEHVFQETKKYRNY